MPTYRVVPAGTASGIHKTRRGAMYGHRETLSTIAVADRSTKPMQIAPPKWKYRPGACRLIKASEVTR